MTPNSIFLSGKTSLQPAPINISSLSSSFHSTVTISNDLTPHIDKPMWPLSSYAPAKHEPLLIPGLDESPEELRVKAAAAVASGNINSYVSSDNNCLYYSAFDFICNPFICSLSTKEGK